MRDKLKLRGIFGGVVLGLLLWVACQPSPQRQERQKRMQLHQALRLQDSLAAEDSIRKLIRLTDSLQGLRDSLRQRDSM
ncbi:MAG: hypothetical protein D6730_21025 [Bacteroidetes bacterium]|nr:MAG: hypothetical protein D6730_21025 [Bacteroidota bacterium]